METLVKSTENYEDAYHVSNPIICQIYDFM